MCTWWQLVCYSIVCLITVGNNDAVGKNIMSCTVVLVVMTNVCLVVLLWVWLLLAMSVVLLQTNGHSCLISLSHCGLILAKRVELVCASYSPPPPPWTKSAGSEWMVKQSPKVLASEEEATTRSTSTISNDTLCVAVQPQVVVNVGPQSWLQVWSHPTLVRQVNSSFPSFCRAFHVNQMAVDK